MITWFSCGFSTQSSWLFLTLIFPRYFCWIYQGTSPNAPLSEEVMLINGGDWWCLLSMMYVGYGEVYVDLYLHIYIYDVYNLRNMYRIHFYMFLFSWISYNSFCCDYEECNLLSISSGTLVQFVFFLGNHSTSFGGFRYAWYDSTPYYEPEGFHV